MSLAAKLVKIQFRNGLAHHEFALGVGPCGKTVIDLGVTVGDGYLSIAQTCAEDEGMTDTFNYPLDVIQRWTVYRSDPNVCAVKHG